MASAYQLPGTQQAITIGLHTTPLGSDTNLLSGRESTAVASGNWSDVVVSGRVMTGTSPTTAREIRVYVLAQRNDTPTYPCGATGVDAALSVASAEVRDAGMFLARVMGTNATSNVGYEIKPFSLMQVCGFLPKRWSIFIVHSTGVALNSTSSNHEVTYIPYTWNS